MSLRNYCGGQVTGTIFSPYDIFLRRARRQSCSKSRFAASSDVISALSYLNPAHSDPQKAAERAF